MPEELLETTSYYCHKCGKIGLGEPPYMLTANEPKEKNILCFCKWDCLSVAIAAINLSRVYAEPKPTT